MASSTVRMSCSRETCFSALSWRRAPTKSRLMSFVLLSESTVDRVAAKKNVGVTHVPGGHISSGKYTREQPAAKIGSAPPGGAGGGPGSGHAQRESRLHSIDRVARRRAESPLHVLLQDADELVDEALAAQGPVQASVHE